MYSYHKPTPLMIPLKDKVGLGLRQKTADYLKENLNTTGAERGSEDRQGYGALAEVVVRHYLGMSDMKLSDQSPAYDLMNNGGVKFDVKCRGGEKPFQEEYASSDGFPREAKHNLFVRQVFDDNLDTDVYIMTHLEHPKIGDLPGTTRQRKWNLYVCGWVSKERAKRNGVYLPSGSLTERGISGWFPYKYQEMEFYNKNLNGFKELEEILKITKEDVKSDAIKKGDLNLTSVDAIRIVYDLVGRGLLDEKIISKVKRILKINKDVKPFLHPNQYYHLLQWLKDEGIIKSTVIEKANKILPKTEFEGL